eukprot:TRINITY_DN5925_c0_g1_i4.p1 TRINITY_DN5925_c0_g1~~TRINITY_DN5925_c0_g1_i4.p1  ORF type:complete len:543 (-),score=115.86 TRINITY_DN5925_c0_g1_i4:109-1737(-)
MSTMRFTCLCALLVTACAARVHSAPACTFSEGEEYIGNDLKVIPSSSSKADCCTACTQYSPCRYFTYDSSTHTCSLKSDNAPDTSKPNPACSSGFVGTDPPAISSAQQGGYSLLRFGGSGNDYLSYAVNGTSCPAQSDYRECLNETWWGNTLDFTRAAKAKIVIGLSLNTGHDRRRPLRRLLQFPQVWDPSNARQLLQWTINRGDSDLIFGVELGNEQNSKYTGQAMASNFKILSELLSELWPAEEGRPRLIGPDPHSFKQDGVDQKTIEWIQAFMIECTALQVPLHAVSHHEYIEVDEHSFTSPTKLDLTGTIAAAVNASVSSHLSAAQPWAGEIGPHNGGSPPCDHSSMRWANYGDSLWYADAMALKAVHGYGAFCRQDYIGADYGLVDCSTGAPLPDFWTAILFGQLMGPAVLRAELRTPNATAIRAYAHCTAGSEASVTFLLINLAEQGVNVTLGLDSAAGLNQTEYKLQQRTGASSMDNSTGLLGTGIKLNGQLLQLTSTGAVPGLVGVAAVSPGEVRLEPQSVNFVVVASPSFDFC